MRESEKALRQIENGIELYLEAKLQELIQNECTCTRKYSWNLSHGSGYLDILLDFMLSKRMEEVIKKLKDVC